MRIEGSPEIMVIIQDAIDMERNFIKEDGPRSLI
jgi:hypothetical protein